MDQFDFEVAPEVVGSKNDLAVCRAGDGSVGWREVNLNSQPEFGRVLIKILHDVRSVVAHRVLGMLDDPRERGLQLDHRDFRSGRWYREVARIFVEEIRRARIPVRTDEMLTSTLPALVRLRFG